MFSVAVIRDLFRHMEWADADVWKAVLACEPARSDETLRALLLHLHVVQRAFLDVWTGRPLEFPQPSAFPDITQLQAWAAPFHAEAAAFLDGLNDEALAQPKTLPWVAEFEKAVNRTFSTPTLAETMFQITSHTTYHRGQVNLRLRAVGGEPPLVDYIAWIWFGRPGPT
jgi:uncharacterized damage-inducible protein DinB